MIPSGPYDLIHSMILVKYLRAEILQESSKGDVISPCSREWRVKVVASLVTPSNQPMLLIKPINELVVDL